jgi:hypothetical protein
VHEVLNGNLYDLFDAAIDDDQVVGVEKPFHCGEALRGQAPLAAAHRLLVVDLGLLDVRLKVGSGFRRFNLRHADVEAGGDPFVTIAQATTTRSPTRQALELSQGNFKC